MTVTLYVYNGPGMSPWSQGPRRPSNPPDDTQVVYVGTVPWIRSIRRWWVSEWHKL